MAQDVYKLTTLNLFEDLKNTNISNGEFKEIIASYSKLGQEYIRTNQADLFKDLNKQKEVIFSYLPSLRKENIKKVANLQKQLEAELGNVDEINTFQTPEKKVQFIKVAYNNGKWTITAKNLEGLEFTDKETPQAISSLVNVCNRLDEQEAAYALCHAKKAGLFTMAELPYVRTEDLTNTALEQKFTKDPGTVLGPVEHSWESSVDNTNMPVSRQIASEDSFQEMDTFKDEDGDMITISSISGDAVITFDNDIFTKEEVRENIESGYWTKVEAAEKDVNKVAEKQLSKIEAALSKIEEQQVLLAAIDKVTKELTQKLENVTKKKLEAMQEIIDKLMPKVLRILRKIDSLTFNNEECKKKLQVLKLQYKGLKVTYNPEVENYQKRVVGVAQVEEVLAEIRKYVSPRYIKEYEKLTEKLFQYTSRLEKVLFSLDQTNPEISEKIEEQAEILRKSNLKTASFNIGKDKAYAMLENMLVDNIINFDQYTTFTNFADINAKKVISCLKEIEPVMRKQVHCGIFDNIVDIVSSIYNSAKDWILDAISLFSIQEKQIKDINDRLDEIIQEGE